MCMNCGCGQPGNDHGKAENITADDLQRAADANDQSLRESAQHMVETVALLDASSDPDRGLGVSSGPAPAATGGRGTPASES